MKEAVHPLEVAGYSRKDPVILICSMAAECGFDISEDLIDWSESYIDKKCESDL